MKIKKIEKQLKKINQLFERSKKGILFGVKTKKKLGAKIEKLNEKEVLALLSQIAARPLDSKAQFQMPILAFSRKTESRKGLNTETKLWTRPKPRPKRR